MKYLFLIAIFFSSVSVAQTVTVKKIEQELPVGYLSYPVIILKDKVIGEKINSQIRADVLGSTEGKETIKQQFGRLIKEEGLTDITYTITYIKNGLLSMNMFVQGEGASHDHIFRDNYYYNFDLRTGEQLELDSMMDDDRYAAFTDKVFKNVVAALNKYEKQERDSLSRKSIDSESYNHIVYEDSFCKSPNPDTNVLHDFILRDKYIEIIDPCSFEGGWTYLESDYRLLYSPNTMRVFLKPVYFDRIFPAVKKVKHQTGKRKK